MIYCGVTSFQYGTGRWALIFFVVEQVNPCASDTANVTEKAPVVLNVEVGLGIVSVAGVPPVNVQFQAPPGEHEIWAPAGL